MHMVYFALYIWCKITLNFVILEQALGNKKKKTHMNKFLRRCLQLFFIYLDIPFIPFC